MNGIAMPLFRKWLIDNIDHFRTAFPDDIIHALHLMSEQDSIDRNKLVGIKILLERNDHNVLNTIASICNEYNQSSSPSAINDALKAIMNLIFSTTCLNLFVDEYLKAAPQ